MTVIEITNPYFNKTYKVVEERSNIEHSMKNIHRGNEECLFLHDIETGNLITISPRCCASVEIQAESEGK